MTPLSTRGLSVRIGSSSLLDGVDLDVGSGEWLSVIGPNGAGKTTLLRALAGLIAYSGEVRVDGTPAGALRRRARARLVAVVPQSPAVPTGMTVAEYVLLGRTPHAGALGAPSPRDVIAAEEAMHRLDVTQFAERVLATLSGGERQRVFLARALAQDAPVILLDEPTTGLDIGHQQQVLDLIDDLRRERGRTIVSTMHDLSLAGHYGDRVALVYGGRIVAIGPPSDVITEDAVERYYGARVHIANDDGRPVVVGIAPLGARR